MRRAKHKNPHPVILSEANGVHGCGGKRCYDRAGAERCAKATRRQREVRVSAYHCRHCHNWHIGELENPTQGRRPK